MGKTTIEFYMVGVCVFLDAATTLSVLGKAGMEQLNDKEIQKMMIAIELE